MEALDTGLGFQVVIDYAHTPDGLENVLRTIRGYKEGRLIALFGCGGNRDRGKRPQMCRAAASYADFMVVTSDNPRGGEPLRHSQGYSGRARRVRHAVRRD